MRPGTGSSKQQGAGRRPTLLQPHEAAPGSSVGGEQGQCLPKPELAVAWPGAGVEMAKVGMEAFLSSWFFRGSVGTDSGCWGLARLKHCC